MSANKHPPLLIVVAVVAIALNLRPALAAIGPLLDMVESATGMTSTSASLLTTLPVLMMGVCALAGSSLSTVLGERRGIGWGLVLIGVACAARAVAGVASLLLLSALVAGVGIALVQTLIPAFIKRRFAAQAGRVFALYTTGIMGGAAVAATSSAWLAQQLGWAWALAVWALPAVLAWPMWLWASGSGSASAPAAALPGDAAKLPSPAFWRNRRAWTLLVFFGIGTGAYTLVLAWLPPYYTGLGWQASEAGILLGGLTLTEVLAGLAVSAWIGHFPDRRGPLLLALLSLIAGLVLLMAAPLSMALPASGLLGLGIGALFPLSLIVTLDHIQEPTHAGLLVAFVQGGGYIIASGMPLLAGVLRDHFADLSQAWAVMLVGALMLLALCWQFSPTSYEKINASPR